MCVILHNSIKCTAIDRAFHEGMILDRHIRLTGQSQRLDESDVSCFISEIFPRTNILTARPVIIILISVFIWQNTHSGTEHVSFIIRHTTCCDHLHRFFRSDFCIASNGDLTETTVGIFQCVWRSYWPSNRCVRIICLRLDSISGYRSNLTSAKDGASYLGIALNNDGRITTYQCGVAMSLNTLTATIHITFDFGFTCRVFFICHSVSKSNGHHSVIFHSPNLTAAINVTIYRSVGNSDIRSTFIVFIAVTICIFCTSAIHAYHRFVTVEIVCNTLTSTIHITCNLGCIAGRGRSDIR